MYLQNVNMIFTVVYYYYLVYFFRVINFIFVYVFFFLKFNTSVFPDEFK